MSSVRTHLIRWLWLCLFWTAHAIALEQQHGINPFSFSSTTSLLRGPADASFRETSHDEESRRGVEHNRQPQKQQQKQHRSLLQQAQYQCNQVVATIPDARQHLSQLLEAHGYQDSMERERAAYALSSLLKFGVHIYKICASCEDVSSWWETSSTSSMRSTICSGSQTLQSGLLFVPTTVVVASDPSAEEAALMEQRATINQSQSAKSLLPGTHNGVVVVPSQSSSGTLGDLYPIVPSKTEHMGDASSLVVEGWQIQAFVAASAGNIALVPDFMSLDETGSKTFLVKRAYQAGFLPLWFQAKELLASETDCHTALADTALVMGYGDGGYGALSIANVLHEGLGVKVLSTQAGAIPARLGSSMIPKLIQSLDEDRFPKERNYLLALLGAAYSSTQDQDQNLLSSRLQVRSSYMALVETSDGASINDSIDKIIHSLHIIDDTTIMGETIKSAPTRESPLEIWDERFVLAMRNGIETDNFDPCHTPSNLATFDFERLCATLDENDLTADLLEGVQYPVRICHSVDDEVVDISNLPNFSANKEYLSYTQIKGMNHVEAARECMMESLLILRNLDADLSQTKTADLHGSSCQDMGESLNEKTGTIDNDDDSDSKKSLLDSIGGIFLFLVLPMVALASTITYCSCRSKKV
eukprot:CAMPEP_0198285442 /NCGR_PEP_ID=MMETSP1449-20131203/4719_1 /TAXON_ID=420275 /ORGANISM="Attheya septentrionalis, Strain CCMP2084" /LENGTH=643 /DNA_ID=CAMNT_0043982849 /DNA_START=263 /DNA_END=2194 /DNA_ORIENTATION=+